jgi:hypothetical protein
MAGQTKTRLTPPLTGEQAASLYECFLQDTLELMQTARRLLPMTLIIAYLPADGEAYFRQLAPDFDLLLQQGNDLSERLDNALSYCLGHGYDQAVIMDSDSPTLSPENLAAAFTALDLADVSLGPCDDGGYYLIGLKKPASSLFLKVTMSTDHVTQDTLKQAELANLTAQLLPTSYDIDYAADLRRLIDELDTLPLTTAPHTRAFLRAYKDTLSL